MGTSSSSMNGTMMVSPTMEPKFIIGFPYRYHGLDILIGMDATDTSRVFWDMDVHLLSRGLLSGIISMENCSGRILVPKTRFDHNRRE